MFIGELLIKMWKAITSGFETVHENEVGG